MKTSLAAALALVAAVTLHGAALIRDVNVHSRPEIAAPVIARLKAGVEPAPARGSVASTPAGWMAVDLPGPFEVFVANGDINKALDVREGASLLTEPRAGASVLGTMEKGDKAEITGLRGRFTGIKVERNIVGYILLGDSPSAGFPSARPPAPIGAAPSAAMSIPPPQAILERSQPRDGPPPSMVSTLGSPVAGGAAPAVAAGALPRTMQGHFASSQRAFTPRRPYDFQLNDDAGVRIAYVDLSKVILPDLPEKYVGRTVVVTGIAENSVEARAVVIAADSFQVR